MKCPNCGAHALTKYEGRPAATQCCRDVVYLRDKVFAQRVIHADLKRRIAKAKRLMRGSGTPDEVLAALDGD